MTDLIPSPTLEAARLYLQRGWSPIPLAAGTKWPPPNGVTGWRGRYTTTHDLTRKGFDWSGNIAIRLPPDVVGIDIDVYHGGDDGLAELIGRFGQLPETTYSTSRTDGSGIALFRVPVGTVLATDPAEGIDMIQAHHRYVVCAPSIHPDGRPYGWIDDQAEEQVDGPPEPGELPELPWPWIEGLAMDKTAGVNAVTPDTAQTFVTTHTTRTKPGALEGIRTHLKTVRKGGRHDALVSTMCWAMREAAAGLYTADEAITTIHSWWIDVVSDQPHRRDNGEFGGAILWAIGQTGSAAERINQIREAHTLTTLIAPTNGHRPPNVNPTTGEILSSDSYRNLPTEFWEARPELAHIHQAAHARARSADAVLLFTLARVCATIPSNIRLPPIVGGDGSLNFLGAVIGTSGSGKSTAGAVARALIPIDRRDVLADLPLGSGEGLVEQYFEWVNEEQPDGKFKKVKRKTRDGLYMYLDEGQALGEMGSRKGATLLPTLRAAWSGETIGNANASAETHRVINEHTYRLAMMVGFQAEHATGLLDDVIGGLPQRFVFASAVDTTVPDTSPEWPGLLDTQLPAIAGIMYFDVDPAIATEIQARDRAATRGLLDVNPLDSHIYFVRLKVAALLGYLDGRLNVDPEDWELAELVMRSSCAVRTWVIEIARNAATNIEMTGHRRAATREIIVATEGEKWALGGAARAVARRVHRDSEPVGRHQLGQAIAGKHRKIVTVDDAIEEAERLRWITRNGELGWTSGEAKPT